LHAARIVTSDTVSAHAWATVFDQESLESTAHDSTVVIRGRILRFLHVLWEPRSYLNALYLLTAFPLGLTYFFILLIGGVVGALFTFVLVGLLILLAALVAAWGFALFERELAIGLLGAKIAPLSLPNAEVISPWRTLARHLRQPATWRSLAFLVVKMPFGIFATGLSLALIGPCLVGIVYALATVSDRGPFGIGALIFPGVVAVLGLALSFHILNWVGRAWGRFAADMLGVSEEQRQVWEARRRAEAADRSRRDLIMNVSHELRTPVATIQAHVDSLLLPGKDRPNREESDRRLRITAAETRRLADLIEDLLMLARADADDLRVTNRPIEMAPVAELVAASLAPLARQERQVTVTHEDLPAGLWASADPDRLTQVLTNLVRNAVNYTPEGGVVSIRLSAEPEHVRVGVSDTGVGISPEDLEHVFDRFYRADSSRARNSGGFGLGLSIARELVEAMGGTLTATSEPGLGSTFWVSLRRVQVN
jgi:two-component system, OmpR family, phosphate regulon sensor histidine kinase PhoR